MNGKHADNPSNNFRNTFETASSRTTEGAEFTVVIPARHEERELPLCLAAIAEAAAAAGTSVELIVVLNRCTDRTEEIARTAGAKVLFCGGKNLSQIRNTGVQAATCPWVVTIDADSRMSSHLFLEARKALRSERVIGGGVIIYPERWSLGILITGVYLLPIVLIHRISGGLFFFKKQDFDAIGGFNETLSSAEDIDFAKRLRALGKRNGRKFKTLSRAWIVTSCRKFDTFGDWHFALRPWLILTLLRGRHQAQADKYWYDFPRN